MRLKFAWTAREGPAPGVRRATDYWPPHRSADGPGDRRRAVQRAAAAVLFILLGGGLSLLPGYEAMWRRAAVGVVVVRSPGTPDRLWVEGPAYLNDGGPFGDGVVRVVFVETVPDGSAVNRRDQIVAAGPWGVVRGSSDNPHGDRWRGSLTPGQ